MEAFLDRLLTTKSDFPIWVRYTLTLGLVGIAFFARVMLDDHLRSYPVLLFIPAIFLSSVLFDRGSGILATAAGAILAAIYLIPGPPSSAAIPLVLLVLTGICIAAVTEILRHTLQKLSEAKDTRKFCCRNSRTERGTTSRPSSRSSGCRPVPKAIPPCRWPSPPR
ncbi:DUF4118 domain-containing protein [Bradyrhizobium sp. 62B]|jgi:hypothetical protein|nr:DUF4118 domain-containing protein [Bradyrhizobium sp. 62B]